MTVSNGTTLFFCPSLFIYLSISLSLLLPPSTSPYPSVMVLVLPHVYLCYKAEESGRLKMKTPTRECLCARFVNLYVHWCVCAECETVCEYVLLYPFCTQASFLYSRVEFLSTWPPTALPFSQPPCSSHLLQPQTGGFSFSSTCLIGQVSAIGRKWHSNLKYRFRKLPRTNTYTYSHAHFPITYILWPHRDGQMPQVLTHAHHCWAA